MDNFYDETEGYNPWSTGAEYIITLSTGGTAVITDEAAGMGI